MTDEKKSTAIVVAGSPAPAATEQPGIPIEEDVTVIARSADEMAIAQRDLLGWADRKIASIESELADIEANIKNAQARKWSTAPFTKLLKGVQGRIRYYRTIRAALAAGYVIIPDMPGITIAVRTSRAAPRNTVHSSSYGSPMLPTALSDGSAVGKGGYVSPDLQAHFYDRTSKDAQQRDVVSHHARITGYDRDFEFPIALVKPQILDDTNRAMLAKIFDEIAIVGAGSERPRRLARSITIGGDPIVLGRVVRYEGRKRHSCAFLITWWLDTRTV